MGHDDKTLPPGERPSLGPWQRVKGLDAKGLSGRGLFAARRRLGEFLRQESPDLIHLQNILSPDLISEAVKHAPTVVTVQDHRFFCPGRGKLTAGGEPCHRVMGEECLACFDDQDYGRRLLELTQRRLEALALAKLVLVLSDYMARELDQAWRAHSIKPPCLEVLPPLVHGLDNAPPASSPGGYHLMACRLVKAKGVETALEAQKLLEHPLPLVLAGRGSLEDEVAARAARSRGGLRFAGWANRREMAGLLAGARSLWLPSLWAEPFGIVGLEAFYLAKPVLASRVGGVEQWLSPGRGGLLLEPGDAAGLARAADRLAADPELAKQMGRAGRRVWEENYRPQALMPRLEGLYRGLLA